MSCDLIPAAIGGGLVLFLGLAIAHLWLRIGQQLRLRREARDRERPHFNRYLPEAKRTPRRSL